MPFTFAHPAIVLPIASVSRKWFSLTGLIAGSMTPDFEYLLQMRLHGHVAHTITGIFGFDIPVGLALAFLFHNVARNSLFDNSPTVLKSRLCVFTQFNWNKYFKTSWGTIIISIMIGAASHIFWDSFTHAHGFFVKKLPVLSNSLTILGINIHYYRILQHFSTFIGTLVIVYAIFSLPQDRGIKGKFNLEYWGLFCFVTVAIIAVRVFVGIEYPLYGNLIVTTMAAGLMSLVLTPLIRRGER